jgi:NitT/TauT family transport system substrate-binding protein
MQNHDGCYRESVRWLGQSLIGVLFAVAATGVSSAFAADHIRIATLKTGTLAWELDTLRAYGLDREAELAIDTTELASTEAGKIALKGGSADLIVSDWLWVSRERALGDDLVFYPYSSALGAVMVPANSPINGVVDLKGKKLGVAGGPLDKSWILLQALARRSGVDLKRQAAIAYGAPPLLAQKALQGETDATLTFWNFSAELEVEGMRPAISMQDVVRDLGAGGAVSMVGYVFNGSWARHHAALLERFLRQPTRLKRFFEIRRPNGSGWRRASGRRIRVRSRCIVGIFLRASRNDPWPMRWPTLRHFITCWLKSAVRSWSVRRAISIRALFSARGTANESRAAARLCRLAVGGVASGRALRRSASFAGAADSLVRDRARGAVGCPGLQSRGYAGARRRGIRDCNDTRHRVGAGHGPRSSV